jgi:hypothetical protein
MKTSIVRFVAAAVVVATTATSAFAYLPRNGEPTISLAPARFTQSAVCTPQQNGVVEAAFADARRRVQRAIDFIDANPGHEHIRTWFGDQAKIAYLRHSYVRILAAMEPANRPTVYCGTSDCSVFARAWPGQDTMSVCNLFFRARNIGTDARFGVIIHEVSHLVIRTGDHAYGPANARALAARDSHTAQRNADNYEYFVETLPEAPQS